MAAEDTASSSADDAQHRKRHSVTDLMDKLLEDIYRVAGSCSGGSVASESSTDQTNWSDGGGGGVDRSTIGSTKRLARKSKRLPDVIYTPRSMVLVLIVATVAMRLTRTTYTLDGCLGVFAY